MPEPRWRRYLRFWRRNVAADIDDELRFHFSERVAELESQGLSHDEAIAAAHEDFGDERLIRAELVAIDDRVAQKRETSAFIDALRSDLGSGVRSLARQPAFSVAVVVTLALGLGVNAAMFSFLDRVFLKAPSGIQEPSQLRRFWAVESDRKGQTSISQVGLGLDAYKVLVAALSPDANLALYALQGGVRFDEDDESNKFIVRASPEYFTLLGVHAARGRLFTNEETDMTAPAPVAVISDALWRSRFGTDEGVVGKPVLLNGIRHTIIGVATPGFRGTDLNATDVWTPLSPDALGILGRRRAGPARYFDVLGRRTSNVSDAALDARATIAIRQARAGEVGADSLHGIMTGSIIEARGPGNKQREVVVAERLGAVAIIVLLVACANVMNMLLARGIARRREIAVRVALGISRPRLVWLLAAPNIVLALAAGTAAAASAHVAGAALRSQLTPDVQFADPPFEWRVVAFTLSMALLAGAVAAIVPAIHASRPDVTTFLKSGAQTGVVQRSRLRTSLLILQAALSVVLLVGAGLFVRSLRNVESIRIGYDAEQLLFASPRTVEAPDSARMVLAAERIGRIPGVVAVGMSTMLPMSGGLLGGRFYTATDSSHGERSDWPSFMGVSPNYFVVTGTRIVRGTGFASEPTWSIVVNETMAREYWPRGDAIGQCMHLSKRENPCYTVVAIAEDAHRRTVVEKPHAHYFVPLTHPPSPGMRGYTLIMRVQPDRMSLAIDESRRVLRDVFPGAHPVLRRMDEAIAPAYRPFRLGARLFSAFGALAFVVAMLGVYSTISYTVQQRAHEFGVRIALGAGIHDVLFNVLGSALGPVLIGVGVGLAIALTTGHLIASLLYGLSPRDGVVLAMASGVLLAAACLAALIPSIRAARTDPIIALKAE